jgi:hypothetical protein
MSDQTEGTILAETRDRLAQRARLPWWYVALQGLALLGLLAAPLVSRSSAGVYNAVMWPSVLLLVFGDLLLRRLRGVAFSRRTLLAYPSTRRAGLALLAVGVAGVVAVNVLVRADLAGLALALAIAVAACCTALLLTMNAGMRRDIRAGRVLTP